MKNFTQKANEIISCKLKVGHSSSEGHQKKMRHVFENITGFIIN